MGHILDRPVLMVTTPGGLPRRFRWQGRWFWVDDVLEFWRDTGQWWEGEAEKAFFRLQAGAGGAGKGLFELYRVESGEWRLYKVYD